MKNIHFVGISNTLKLIYKISALTFLLGYLIFHAINGENGIRAYFKVKKEVAEQSALLEKLTNKLQFIEIDVKHLSSSSLDLDILEERARQILNYSYPSNIIVRIKTIME